MKQFWLRKRHARWNSLEFMKSCLGAEIETRWDVELFDQKRYKNLTQHVLELRFFWIYSIHHCFRSITCTDLSHLDAFWWQIRSGQGTKWWQRLPKMAWNHDKNMPQHVFWLGFFTIWSTRSHWSSISVTDLSHFMMDSCGGIPRSACGNVPNPWPWNTLLIFKPFYPASVNWNHRKA